MSERPGQDRTAADIHEARLARADRLLEVLALERIEQNLYRGVNEHSGQRRLFGGQVLAQALQAASATVEGRLAHSVHGYFMRAGDASRPVLYEVDRIRDGRAFTTRRVVAIQEGEAIFSMSVSLQIEEQGFEHAASMPNVPPPDELEDDMIVASGVEGGYATMAGRARPFETRSVFALGSDAWRANRYWNPVWIRFAREIPADDEVLSRCLLAYASDMGVVSTSLLPHGETVSRSSVQMASLDHALWIHRSAPVNDWMLFHKHTSSASGARGLAHAAFYDRAGTLVASVTQEGLVRSRRPAAER